MKYNYRAVDAAGKKTKGVLEAESEMGATAQLREMRLVPVELNEAGVFFGKAQPQAGNVFEAEIFETEIHKQKFKKKKLLLLFNQLAVMLKAGINLSLAIEVMLQNEPDKKLNKVLAAIHEDMLSGLALSDSMAQFACFDSVAVNLVRAGEADGRLERSFAQIATVIEKAENVRSKIVSASIYPCILLVAMIAVVTLLNTTILPNFMGLFESLGTGVPFFTQLLLSASQFFNHWWWVFVIIIVGLVFGYRALRDKKLSFAVKVDKLKLHVPLAGKLIKNSQIARFARVLSTLLDAGHDFLGALAIGQSVMTNEYMKAGLDAVADEVRIGNPVSSSMGKQTFFAPVFISMVRAGEESGAMGETLSKMADLYEAETDESAKRLTTMMEPLMTILIAGVVGVVVLGVAMPMFSMFDLVGNV